MDNHDLFFEDCRVPKENLIGKLGKGFSQFLDILDYGRTSIAAIALGAMQRSLDEALSYSKIRVQFNQPIFNFQMIQMKLADMAMNLELSRLMIWKAAHLADIGEKFTKEVAYAKLFATEAAVKTTNEAVQIFGGNGYMEEYPIGRFWRDVKLLTIGEGTSEIMRVLIARNL
jgi:butyryl-CoA dehydrogenase